MATPASQCFPATSGCQRMPNQAGQRIIEIQAQHNPTLGHWRVGPLPAWQEGGPARVPHGGRPSDSKWPARPRIPSQEARSSTPHMRGLDGLRSLREGQVGRYASSSPAVKLMARVRHPGRCWARRGLVRDLNRTPRGFSLDAEETPPSGRAAGGAVSLSECSLVWPSWCNRCWC